LLYNTHTFGEFFFTLFINFGILAIVLIGSALYVVIFKPQSPPIDIQFEMDKRRIQWNVTSVKIMHAVLFLLVALYANGWVALTSTPGRDFLLNPILLIVLIFLTIPAIKISVLALKPSEASVGESDIIRFFSQTAGTSGSRIHPSVFVALVITSLLGLVTGLQIAAHIGVVQDLLH